MIKVDISTALFIYLLFSVVLVLLAWLFLNFGTRLKYRSSDDRHIWNCSTCSYTYIDSRNDDISRCPRCSSYNEKIVPEKLFRDLARQEAGARVKGR